MTDEPQNDVSNPAGDAGQVNPQMAQKVMALFGQIDSVMDELNVPSQDRNQVMQNLMEAIAADLMTRLGTRMSEEEKNELADMAEGMDTQNPDLQSVAGFFRGKFTQEELMDELAGATEGVLKDFMTEMGK